MGSSLRRQLREALPDSIKGLQRAIALEIADDARYDDTGRYDPENGRCSKARMAELVRWTAAKDELSVREMLRRLAVAGWEFRVPIGTGKDGRPLYAVPGKAMQFRVPDFKAPTVVGPCEVEGQEGPTVVGPSETEGPTVVAEGPTTVGEGPTVVAEGPTVVGPPSPLHLSSSPRNPTTSVAEPVEDTPEPDGDEGGGGSDLRSMAQQITSALDYRGKPPSRQQQNQITDRLVAALQAGWTVDQLAVHLDIDGQDVRYPAAVYLARLDPARIATPPAPQVPSARRGGARAEPLPASAYAGVTTGSLLFDGRRDTADGGMWERAMARAQQRTAAMAGGGHRPYSNDVWTRPADPDEAASIPHCGDLDCDPRTRLKDHEDDKGLKFVAPCEKCHPKMQWQPRRPRDNQRDMRSSDG